MTKEISTREIAMRNKLRIISRFGMIGLVAGLLGFAVGTIAQTESPKKSESTASAEGAKAASSLSEKDKTFVKKAAKGGTMEVEMGKLAEQNAKSDDVKSFGKRMVTDHSKAGDELKAIADKKGAKFPK